MEFDKDLLEKAQATGQWADFGDEDIAKSSADALNLMKAAGNKDLSKLVPVQKQITRNGKQVTQTVWVKPGGDEAKEAKQPAVGKETNDKPSEELMHKFESQVEPEANKNNSSLHTSFTEEIDGTTVFFAVTGFHDPETDTERITAEPYKHENGSFKELGVPEQADLGLNLKNKAERAASALTKEGFNVKDGALHPNANDDFAPEPK